MVDQIPTRSRQQMIQSNQIVNEQCRNARCRSNSKSFNIFILLWVAKSSSCLTAMSTNVTALLCSVNDDFSQWKQANAYHRIMNMTIRNSEHQISWQKSVIICQILWHKLFETWSFRSFSVRVENICHASAISVKEQHVRCWSLIVSLSWQLLTDVLNCRYMF